MPDLAYQDELNAVMREVLDVLPVPASPIGAGDDYVVLGSSKSSPGEAETVAWFDSLQTAGYLLVTGSNTDALFSGSNGEQLQLGDSGYWTTLKIWLVLP